MARLNLLMNYDRQFFFPWCTSFKHEVAVIVTDKNAASHTSCKSPHSSFGTMDTKIIVLVFIVIEWRFTFKFGTRMPK